MQRIKNLIKGRDVAILLHGRSILSTAYFPDEWIYFGLNKFSALQLRFHALDVVVIFSETEAVDQVDAVQRYLYAKEDHLFVTTKEALAHMRGFPLSRYRNQVVAVPKLEKLPHPKNANMMCAPNTLYCLLHYILPLGAKKIHLFGCDGCTNKHNEKKSYFDPKSNYGRKTEIVRDTAVFNAHMPALLDELKATHGTLTPVVNHNPDSLITAFALDKSPP